MSLLTRYTKWLHTQWPAGTIEKLPEVNEDGTTRIAGIRIVGDLTGVPLLKFSVDTGARAVQAILAEPGFKPSAEGPYDIAIIGAGLAGVAAAIEAKRAGLRFVIFEAAEPFATIKDFPKRKPIYTYPTEMKPQGDLSLTSDIKEDLVAELEAQRAAAAIEPVAARIERVERKGKHFTLHAQDESYDAQRVIVAIGRSGNFRKLGVEGEELPKVFHRLHDPLEFAGQHVLVVGGGDSAIEASVALAIAGAHVTHSYRRDSFSRPKPDNIEKLNKLVANPSADVSIEEPASERVTTSFAPGMCPEVGKGSVCLAFSSNVKEITEEEVELTDGQGNTRKIPNNVVFAMTGREPPLDFFRRSGIPIRGEWRISSYASFGLFTLFCIFLYHWKTSSAELPIHKWFQERGWFPFNIGGFFQAIGDSFAAASATKGHLLHTIKNSMADGGFYYTLAYCVLVVVFGFRRMQRRRTPYVKVQTLTLMAIQCVPLFILPQILLPWAGDNGWFESGILGWIGDQFFPDGSYWRAYGFVLAWPLFIWNVFTPDPIWGWLVLSCIQTFVIIPLIIRRWGKGAYCGWICSCGALAETLGDAHRHKMPHGPFWNRLNMVGQVVLAFALILFLLRVGGWIWPGSWSDNAFNLLLSKLPFLNYKWLVDIMLAGVIGVACYFWFSGRVWCRFACPLAALMHVFTRFSRFRIFSEKKKCISCNVCTSVCHQGIDIMNFANKGVPMEDPECVRCSACVQSCPTGVLAFGRFAADGSIRHDRLAASLVRVEEVGIKPAN